MKILRIISSLSPSAGGPVESIRVSSRYHANAGHTTVIVTMDSRESGFQSSFDNDFTEVVPLGKGVTSWAFGRTLLPWLRANLDRFDAVVSHGLWQYHTFAAWMAIRPGRLPWFVYPHGMLDPWFQQLSHRPLKAIRNSVYWKLIEHRVIRDASGVLFTSDQERVLACRSFRPYQCREIVVSYGTEDPPTFTEIMRVAFRDKCSGSDSGERPYLLFLGRIHPKKGLDPLIQAYAEMVKDTGGKTGSKIVASFPNLVIAGPGLDCDYGKRLLLAVRAAGLPLVTPDGKSNGSLNSEGIRDKVDPRVIFTGMLSGDAKWGAIYGCEAFVLPSHQENFGIAVAEALACGKPVLISEQVNIWREIVDAGAGLAEPDTLAGTEALLKQWLALASKARMEMGQRARRCFEQHFALEAAAENLLAVLKGG